MNHDDRIHVHEVTIRYSRGGRMHRMTIPEDTEIDVIVFRHDDDPEEFRELQPRLGRAQGSPTFAKPKSLPADGEGWEDIDVLDTMIESWEDEGEASEPLHSIDGMCVHERGCMWFCLM